MNKIILILILSLLTKIVYSNSLATIVVSRCMNKIDTTLSVPQNEVISFHPSCV